MELKKLQYFLRICELGSLARAAEVLHVAQPALSHHLAALEAYYGVPLLIRSSRGVKPTLAGEELYRLANGIVRQLDRTKEIISSAGEGPKGTVYVGLPPGSPASMLVVPLIRTVQERYPDVVLSFDEGLNGSLVEHLLNRKLDLALLYDTAGVVENLCRPLIEEPLVLVMSRRLANHYGVREGSVAWEDISELPLLLPTPRHTLRQLVEDALQKSGKSVLVKAEIASIASLRQAVGAHLGATILPLAVTTTFDPQIELVTIGLTPSIDRRIFLCGSESTQAGGAPACIYDMVAELSQAMILNGTWPGAKFIS